MKKAPPKHDRAVGLPPLSGWQRAAAMAACAIAIVVTVSFRLYEKDFWQHLAVGRAIWRLHAVPTTQLWTWPTYGAPDVNSSWGFRALLWPVWKLGGVLGLFLWRWATTLLVFGLSLAAARRMGARGLAPLAVMTLCALSYRQRSQVRPETLASVWLALTIWLLEVRRSRWEAGGEPPAGAGPRGLDPAFFLPALSCAWANSHLSFPLGFVVIGAHLLDATFARASGRPGSGAGAGRLWLLALLAAAATFLNPFGWRAVTQPFTYLGAGRHEAIYALIPELRPIELRFQLTNLLPLLLLGWPLLAIRRWRARGLDLVEITLAAFFLPLPFLSQRFVGFTAVAAAPYLARDLDEALRGRRWPRPLRSPGARTSLVAGLCLLMGLPEWRRPEFRLGIGLDWNEYPVAACDFMAREGVKGRGLNPFYYGGYMLYRFWPDRGRLPFMDIHQTGTLEDRDLYARAMADPAAFGELVRRHSFDYVLWRRTTYGDRVLEFLDQDSTFALVFLDDAAALYLRAPGPLGDVAERFRYRVLPAGTERLGALGAAVLADSARRVQVEAELEREVAGSPYHSLALVRLGSVALALGRLEEARARLRAALVVNPDAPRAHDRLGWIALRTGDPRGAIRELETERRLHGAPPRLHLGLGKAWQELGDAGRARRAYARELEAYPADGEARDSLASPALSR